MREINSHYTPEASSEGLPDFATKIHELMQEIPEGVVSEEAVGHAAALLGRMHEAYDDPKSSSYRPYHNSRHNLSVLRRAWRLWGLFQEKLPERFDDAGYETLLLGACGHELFVEEDTESGKDEKRSGKYTLRYMIGSGYSHEESQRVYCAIEATAVERNAEGSIIQYNVQKGSKDPAKLILAMADINGIPMEGAPTMFEDAMNLYMEFSHTSMKELLHHPKKATDFMLTQADFLEDRLNAMPADIAYYFTGEEKQIVEEIFSKEFSGSTREALALASRMKNMPTLAEFAVDKALATTKGASNISALPKRFGSLITRFKDKE